jgi:hypothetical protein
MSTFCLLEENMKSLMTAFVVGVVCSFAALFATRAEEPSVGKPLKTSYELTGADSHVTKRRYERITTADQWTRVWQEHIGEKPTGRNEHTVAPLSTPSVDFNQSMVIAIFQGESWNSRGLEVVSIVEEDSRIVFKFTNKGYQTVNKADKVTVYGFFAVPRSTKPVVLVEEIRNMRGPPPKLIERTTFPKL